MSLDSMLTSYIDPDVLKKDIKIDPTKMDENMREHASLYVHYAVQAVRARRQYERWKTAFELLESQLDAKHREALKESGAKVTEAQIRAAMVQDPSWTKCSAQVIEAQQVFRLAEIAERSFDQRKDMLLQLARDAAREREGQLRVNGVTAGREGVLTKLAEQRTKAEATS